MSSQSYLLVMLNLAMIGSLPFVALRRGRLTLGWWATCSPLILVGCAVIAAWTGLVPEYFSGLLTAREATLTVLIMASASLMAYTAGSHRVRLSLWHQREDAPVEIVTWGPYRYVRHPFYVSFHLTLIAGVLAVPGWLTGAALVLGFAALRITAVQEERRLVKSELGARYAEYLKQTGRFVPRPRSMIGAAPQPVPEGRSPNSVEPVQGGE